MSLVHKLPENLNKLWFTREFLSDKLFYFPGRKPLPKFGLRICRQLGLSTRIHSLSSPYSYWLPYWKKWKDQYQRQLGKACHSLVQCVGEKRTRKLPHLTLLPGPSGKLNKISRTTSPVYWLTISVSKNCTKSCPKTTRFSVHMMNSVLQHA